MTDTTITVDTSAVAKRKDAAADGGVDAALVGQLVEQARTAGLQLTGDGGLLQQLTKRVLESALDGEITDHLGYDKGDPAGNNGGNSRNCVRTWQGGPDRGRAGPSFGPWLVSAFVQPRRRSRSTHPTCARPFYRKPSVSSPPRDRVLVAFDRPVAGHLRRPAH